MAYRDLREFIAEPERRGLLKRIKIPVSAEPEITDRVSKFKDGRNVALLFENVKSCCQTR